LEKEFYCVAKLFYVTVLLFYVIDVSLFIHLHCLLSVIYNWTTCVFRWSARY